MDRGGLGGGGGQPPPPPRSVILSLDPMASSSSPGPSGLFQMGPPEHVGHHVIKDNVVTGTDLFELDENGGVIIPGK